MARINIELPERFSFSTRITLLNIHINFGGHLDNALLLSLVSEARMRMWKSLGYPEARDLGGVLGFVADAAVQYLSEAHHGETMFIELAARDFAKHGFDLVWRISEQSSSREVARGKTGIVCIDRQTRKVAALPERLLQQLQTPGGAD